MSFNSKLGLAMNTVALIGALGGIALVFLVFRTGLLPLLYDARIGEAGIDFVIFYYVKISTLPYSRIERVKEVGFLGTLTFNAVNFCNRSLTRALLIEKKSGWYTRRVLITPANIDYFKMVLAKEGVACS